MQKLIASFGNWLAQHQRLIRLLQWFVILLYAALIIVPSLLPLPTDAATIFNNLTIFAQFMFWGIWWPFVLLSIVLFGRLWCGVLCPEGSLSEFANRYGKQKAIPKWLRWGGWPFVAFLMTTIYGQMTSVYQYPKPTLLILGGSTLAAIIIGLIYGESSRIWCKYLCPVNGVLAILARLSPYRFKPDRDKWHAYTNTANTANTANKKIIPIHCPTVLPLRTMTGAADCLMCGRCSNHRNSIELSPRSPNEEIVIYGKTGQSIWTSILIIYGLCGIALAAFQWTNSFWFNHLRDIIDSWFLAHNILWVFNNNAPWWIFTNYPEVHDVFSWLFGVELIGYIVAVGASIATLIFILLSIATKIANKTYSVAVFNHLTQALAPLGACSVFIGLFALTTTILQKYANLGFFWLNDLKAGLLLGATLWSTCLAWQIIKQYTRSKLRFSLSLILLICALAIVNYSWVLVLHVWTLKSDSIPWNTLWVNF